MKRRILALLLLFAFALSCLVGCGARVVSYRSLNVDEGTFMYLYSYFRYRIPVVYKSAGVKDTAAFWNAPFDETQTNGEYYGKLALQFVYQTIVSARIFDSESSLSSAERKYLKELQEEALTLDYKGGGDEKSFNEKASTYGFDYDDFCEGTLLLYKASKAKAALYGTTGILAEEEDLNAFLENNYVRIKMIFVRTKDRFVFDESGNYVRDENGNYKTEPLPEEVKIEKEQKISALLADIENGITEAEFDALITARDPYFNDDSSYPAGGYYFNEHTAYTKAYAKAFGTKAEGEADIISTALAMKVGEVRVVESEYGTHFLYAAKIEDGDYKQTSGAYADMFSEFYSLAADTLFTELLAKEIEQIKIKNSEFIDALDFVSTPPNKELWIAF